MNAPSGGNQPDPSVPKATILVVQDEFLLRMATAADLRGRGYRVIEAFGADDARRALHAEDSIALVLLDITMAGEMNGLVLARWIQVHHPRSKVLVTAAVHPDGDVPILAKPFRPVDLLLRIEAILRS